MDKSGRPFAAKEHQLDLIEPGRAVLLVYRETHEEKYAKAAKFLEGHKIPPFEQTLSAAAAVMNILNAAHALGFGAKWVTGANCYDAAFRAAFGLGESDQLIGFIHLGTPLTEVAAVRPDPGEFFSEWG